MIVSLQLLKNQMRKNKKKIEHKFWYSFESHHCINCIEKKKNCLYLSDDYSFFSSMCRKPAAFSPVKWMQFLDQKMAIGWLLISL